MNANHIKNSAITKVFAIATILFVLLFAVNVPAFANDVPATFDGARIGDVYYSTLYEALANAGHGDVITLLEDCVLYSGITIDKDITLDLGGFTVTVQAMGDAVTVLSSFTVIGDGSFVCNESDLFTVGSDSEDGELIIRGGRFIGYNSVIKVVNGSAKIYGGDFSIKSTGSADKLLAIADTVPEGATATIKVNGGVFHGFDPAGEGNFLGEACGSSSEGDVYTMFAHSFSEFTYNDDANCAHDATETAKCDNCDFIYTRSVPGTKLYNHSFEYFKCVVCGYVQLTSLGLVALGIVVFTILFFFAGISKLVR